MLLLAVHPSLISSYLLNDTRPLQKDVVSKLLANSRCGYDMAHRPFRRQAYEHLDTEIGMCVLFATAID